MSLFKNTLVKIELNLTCRIWGFHSGGFEEYLLLGYSTTLKMEAIRSSETSGTTQRTTRRHIPEEDTLLNLTCFVHTFGHHQRSKFLVKDVSPYNVYQVCQNLLKIIITPAFFKATSVFLNKLISHSTENHNCFQSPKTLWFRINFSVYTITF
jgi:hypothetical protein